MYISDKIIGQWIAVNAEFLENPSALPDQLMDDQHCIFEL